MTKLNKWMAILICTTILASLLSACAHPATGGSSSVPDSTSSTPVSSVEMTSSEPSVSSKVTPSTPASSVEIDPDTGNPVSKPIVIYTPAVANMNYIEYFSEERFSNEGFYGGALPQAFQVVDHTPQAAYRKSIQIFHQDGDRALLLYSNLSAHTYAVAPDGYLYVAEGNCLVRLDEEKNRSVLYSGEDRICFLAYVNPCVLLFHDGEMAYRMFLPTGQVDPLCEVESPYTEITFISNTDFLLTTPDKSYIAHADAGGNETNYNGSPFERKIYSTQTRKFYTYDPTNQKPGASSESWAKIVLDTYIDQRAADLKKQNK